MLCPNCEDYFRPGDTNCPTCNFNLREESPEYPFEPPEEDTFDNDDEDYEFSYGPCIKYRKKTTPGGVTRTGGKRN